MSDHTALLKILAARGLEPRHSDNQPEYRLLAPNQGYTWCYCGLRGHHFETNERDAHNAIELAAIKGMPKESKVQPMVDHWRVWAGVNGTMLFTGPTLVAALLAYYEKGTP